MQHDQVRRKSIVAAGSRDLAAGFFCALVMLFAGSLAQAQAVTATLSIGGSPIAVAVNPLTNRIYVANHSASTIRVIDGATNVPTTIAVGSNPAAIAVNTVTNKIYVANQTSGDVTVIDGSTNATLDIAIGAGAAAAAVAVNPVTNKIYVANSGHNTVSIIDGVTNTVIGTAFVGNNPRAIAVHPVNGLIFVANALSGNVSVIDATTNNVTATIATGALPAAIAVDPTSGGFAWVANSGSNTVSLINASSKVGVDRIVGTNPVAIAVNPATKKVYVANQGGSNVTMIAGTAGTAVSIATGLAPQSVTIDPVTNRIYTANGAGSVTIIDGATDALLATLGAGGNTIAIAVNPVTNRIYAANNLASSLSVIDGSVKTLTTATTGTDPIGVAINPLTNKIYVANNTGNNVTVIDGTTNATVTVPAGTNPRAIAVNPVTNRIYVANNGSDNVTVIDGSNHSTVTIAAGTNPYAIAVNPVTNKTYVANNGSANVTVIDGADNSTNTVPAGFNPHAIDVNPATNKIYVANNSMDVFTLIDGASNAAENQAGNLVNPVAVAVNPVTNRIYIANGSAAKATIIDGNTNLPTQVVVGTGSAAIAVNQATNRIYVVNRTSNNVTVINGNDNSTLTVPTGLSPNAVAINPLTNKIYVTNTGSGTITIIDGTDHSTTTVNVSANPLAVAVNPVTGAVYVSHNPGTTVTRLTSSIATLASHTTSVTMPGGNVTSGTNAALTFTVGGPYAPIDPAVRSVVYRLGDAQGSFASAGGTGPFTASVAGLIPGINYVTAFALDAMEGTSINGGASNSGGTSSIIGAPVVFPVIKVDNMISTASPLPNASLRSNYSRTLAAQGTPPFTYALTAGALPAGFALSPAGVISGWNGDFGATYNFTVTVTDASGNNASKVFSLTVAAGGPFPLNIGLTFLPVPYTVGDNTLRLRATLSQSILPTGADGKVRFRQGGTIIPGCESFDVNVGDIFPTTVDCLPPTFVPPFYPMAVGSYGYTVEYSGGSAFFAASASADLVVNKATPTVFVTGNGTSIFGASVPLQAIVQGRPGFTPTGSVTFQAGGVDIAGCVALPLNSGGATCDATTLPVAIHSITAVYSGDASFIALTSAAVTHTVYPAAAGIVSRKRHGVVDRDIPLLTGVPVNGAVTVEPRLIGAGHQIVFVFSGPMSQTGTPSVTDAASVVLPGVSAIAAINPLNDHEVIVTITGMPDNRRASVNLASPNNLPAAIYSVSIGFLTGDASNSRAVNAADISAIKANAGQPAGATNFRLDLNASGTIDAGDRAIVKAQSGRVLVP